MKRFLRLLAVAFSLSLVLLAAIPTAAGSAEEAKAEAFIAAVTNIGNTTTIYDMKDAVDYAKSSAVYFDDTSYAGVEEALATLAEKEVYVTNTMAACEAFVDYVSEADELDFMGGSYLEIRAALDSAAEYKSRVNTTYIGVETSLDAFNRLNNKLAEPERASKNYIFYANEIAKVKTYADKKKNYDDALQWEDDVILEYPGVSAATETLEEAADYLDECVSKANAFRGAVAAIGTGGNLYAEISAAFVLLEDTDTTVTGVRSSLNAFNDRVEELSDIIEAANTAQVGIVSAVIPASQESASLIPIADIQKKRRI